MEILKIHNNPERAEWAALTERFTREEEEITRQVTEILADVKSGGDRSLREVTRRVEGRDPRTFEIPADVRAAAAALIPAALKEALAAAKANIETFHRAQLPPEVDIETMPGVRCVQRAVPIRRVGLYIPGGKAPLFSTVLMLAVPARVAGCGEVILCTPARPDGTIAPEILYAADLCGVDRIFSVGGAQAVAAMAYGTESIPRVDKIFGPGNRYVTKAKQLVGANDVAVDLPAGPSEVLVLADDEASPAFAAADLLSQAEHGGDSQAVLVCPSVEFARDTQRAVGEQLLQLRRGETIREALRQSRIVVLDSREKMIGFANAYAPEHLIISMRDAWDVAAQITAAGSVFIGPWSPESAGDYASGTNHTLPTGGWARAYSGVNTDSFLRKITYQELSRKGLAALSPTVIAMAEAEGLGAHAAAVRGEHVHAARHAANFLGDEHALGERVRREQRAHRLSIRARGAKFALPARVGGNGLERRRQNLRRGTVVFPQADHLQIRPIARQRGEAARVRAAKAINRLIWVANGEQRLARRREMAHQPALHGVDILEFVLPARSISSASNSTSSRSRAPNSVRRAW